MANETPPASTGARSVATTHTLDFVVFYLPREGGRVLEVGCGSGDLAVALQRLGHRVTAIDPSTDAVAQAKNKGARAFVEDILGFNSESDFDAILFTRSLHHIHPLAVALRKAKSLLAPRGILLIEDFAWERPDAATLTWFYGLARVLGALTEQPKDDSPLANADRLRAAWEEEHRHDPPLHRGLELVDTIGREFAHVETGDCPYLYRSAIAPLEGKSGGEKAMRAILQWEDRLIEEKVIQAIGLRIVAARR